MKTNYTDSFLLTTNEDELHGFFSSNNELHELGRILRMDNMEQDYNIDMCCEPGTATAVATDEWENWEEPEIPYEVDFGYPRTVEELKADVEKAWEERNDSSKWLTHEEFWAKLKHDLPWL